jgi:RNA polymerase sigma-70 factor (ECF subfamily)
VSDSPPDLSRSHFETIFLSHHDPVLRYLVRRSGLREDAADLLAETFLIAWRRVDELPPADQTLPWLYGVARRVLANHRRGESRRLSLADKLRDDLSTAAPAEPTNNPELEQAAAAFRKLSDSDRELLSLVAWEGLDTTELATTLGCSKNAAGVRLHRARRRLERLMRQNHAATGNQSMQLRGERS